MVLIVNILFGSHLYGTETENSDKDYKGVYIPSYSELLLSKFPKNISHSTGSNMDKNTKDDIDTEIFSIHEFFHLAAKGETIQLDMLHAPKDKQIISSPFWDKIVENKHLFLSKNMAAFMGYCRKQAAKYGVKGSRLNAAKEVEKILSSSSQRIQLSYIWDKLPTDNEFLFKREDEKPHRIYEVCGKKYQETASVDYVLHSLSLFIKKYGGRAKDAADNKGIDWKALSHALRATYQLQYIARIGNIPYPLPQREFLKKVKGGELDYLTKVAPILELEIEEASRVIALSKLPDKVDQRMIDSLLIDILEEYHGFKINSSIRS